MIFVDFSQEIVWSARNLGIAHFVNKNLVVSSQESDCTEIMGGGGDGRLILVENYF